jgi:hypothetical protein
MSDVLSDVDVPCTFSPSDHCVAPFNAGIVVSVDQGPGLGVKLHTPQEI